MTTERPDICGFDRESRPRLCPEEVLQKEEQVGRPFGQAPHEIGIPLPAEGGVDAHVIPVFDQLAGQLGADSVKELKLEAVLGNIVPLGELLGFLDQPLIVSADSVIDAAFERSPLAPYRRPCRA